MPQFNRRSFMQLIGAAGLVPVMPALPARAAVGSGGAPTARLLWAGMYARAGNGAKFAQVASRMGLSGQAARGVAARLTGTQVLAAHRATGLGRAAGPSPNSIIERGQRSIRAKISKVFEENDVEDTVVPETEINDPQV